MLIDFGAVKQVGTQTVELEPGMTNLTISIGTQGYMPNEQLAGKPRFSSDIYAVGILGIQALTGIHPRHLGEDLKGEIAWHQHVTDLNPTFMQVLDQMVRYDFRERLSDGDRSARGTWNRSRCRLPIRLCCFRRIAITPSAADPGITIAPPNQSVADSPALPKVNFSEADFTLSGEADLSPTAIWEFERLDNTGNPATQAQDHSEVERSKTVGQSGTVMQPSGGQSANGSNPPAGLNSALTSASGLGDPSGTGLTHAISRPHP